jgi:hypothetical protein
LKLSNNLGIPAPVLKEIIADTLCFDFPVVEVEKAFIPLNYSMGPVAFKDVGAVSCHVVWPISIDKRK